MAIKIDIVTRLQHWMDSVPGQTFLNYAYSWGASIVILGALFKLTHLPGGNVTLFIGMGTEVVVFFLSAFDRPFDKTEIGKELPHEYETDEEIARKLGLTDEDEEEEFEPLDEESIDEEHVATSQGGGLSGGVIVSGGVPVQSGGVAASGSTGGTPAQGGEVQGGGGGTIVIGGFGGGVVGGTMQGASGQESAPQEPKELDAVEAARLAIAAGTPEGAEPFEKEAHRLAEIIRAANDELLRRAQAALSPEMEEATQEYIEKLRVLAETFHKVDEQSARLAYDSEEMANLNRTLTAINKTYELHFKSISQQVGTIEKINEQTCCLAAQIEELNGVYGRMIQALTVNMRMHQPSQQSQQFQQAQPMTQQPQVQQPVYPQQPAAPVYPAQPTPQAPASNPYPQQQGFNNQ